MSQVLQRGLFASVVALLVAAQVASAQAPFERTEARPACADYSPQRRPFFGDLHVHTTYSLDASTQDTRSTPADAYRFARGAALEIQPFDDEGRGLRSLQLDRPLDFAGVTDHAELFGEVEICRDPEHPAYGGMVCRVYRGWPRLAFFLMNGRASRASRYGFCGEDGSVCLEAARGPWRTMQRAADEAYDRTPACRFTSFVAYEYTATALGKLGSNLHRNVVFRNDSVPSAPVSFVDEPTPQGLWDGLDRGCAAQGERCQYLVIPHNSNLSADSMFVAANPDGSQLSAEQARRRAIAEPLVEVIQHKGESECRIGAGTTDELCNFEQLPYDDMTGPMRGGGSEPAAGNFVRPTLGTGLAEHARSGANPFQFGLIGSTDTHLGTPGYVSERAHPGHGGAGLPLTEVPTGLTDRIEFNPGGLAVVWAEENSRDALYAAMRRRETYATSGPRMAVRFFGGWGYPEALCSAADFAEQGYAGGVPMGGELPPAPAANQGPVFAVSALKDAGTAAQPGQVLQRIQIIKLWLDGSEVRERVFDVAGDAQPSASVDLATCEPRGAGFESLCDVWRDPDFDPRQHAVYYARVLENPTCRWHQYICNANQVQCSDASTVPDDLAACCDGNVPSTIQERAWTSPIWYVPQ